MLYGYSGAAVSLQDEGNGNGVFRVQRISQLDGLGRPLSVCEVSGTTLLGSYGTPGACSQDMAATGFLTSYSYDTLDNLTQVAQPGLNNRSMGYDGLSRLTSETVPEQNSLTTSYTYDSHGDLSQRVGPTANSTNPSATTTTTYSHDQLHRLTGISYSDGTPTVTYNYDESAPWGWGLSNYKGRKTTQYTRNASTGTTITANLFNYDAMGRVTLFESCGPSNCSGSSYAVQNGYDLLGDQTSLTTDGFTFTYAFNTAARVTTITSSLNDSQHPGTLFSGAHYNALGEITSGTLGNSLAVSYSYFQRGWLYATNQQRYSITSMGYNNNGTVASVNDSLTSNSWSYTYDDFNRLKTATATGQSYSFEYDRYGNRWHQNGPYSIQLTFSSPYNWIDSYGYDMQGNLRGDGAHNYVYDGEGRLITVDPSSNPPTAKYVYDAEGRRVEIVYPTITKDSIYTLDGKEILQRNGSSGQELRWEIYLGNWAVASYINSTTYFNHVDWLGNIRARSDVGGNSVETCTNLPFGDYVHCTGSDYDPQHFTGLKQDAETAGAGSNTGLDHTFYRQHSSYLGRWLTPDPAGLAAVDPGNPQTWNRYAYVNNNPTNYIDPSGLDAGNPSIWVSAFCQADPIFCAATPAAAHEFCVFIGLCGDSSGGDSGGGTSGGGGSGGGGGAAPTPIPSGNHPIGGSWPNGETNGIPNGFPLPQQNIWSVLLPSGTGCEFGPCVPIPSGYSAGAMAAPLGTIGTGICVASGVCETAAVITGGVLLTGAAIYGGYEAYRYYRIPKAIRDAARKVGVSARALGDAVEQYKHDNGLPPNFNLPYSTIVAIAEALKRGEYYSK